MFLAIEPPARVCAQALAMRDDAIERVRWIHEAQAHITLRFIGEVEPSQEAVLCEALAQLCFQPFSLRLQAPGTFGRPPRVLWLSASPSAPVVALAARIEALLAPLQLDPERLPLLPHLTLARMERPSPIKLKRWMEKHEGSQTEAFQVDSVALYRSELRPEGARYTVLSRFRTGYSP